ncbi:hypothetical protein Dimus_005822 [Dionaea muscipula]
MHTATCKEFYANLIVFINKKKEIAKSRVKGVEIEFDHTKLALILDVPGHTGISEYIKEVWEESKYIKPLEITRKFANNSLINVARRVQSTDMKPFQRFVHFVVMKNVVPRFRKRDKTSFMDLTYMDHMVSGRKINLPRVMMRHMAYVISVKDHELSYGSGENRRRDDDVEAPEEEAEEEEERNQADFDWEAVVDEAIVEGESGSGEKFYDAEDKDQGSHEVNEEIPAAATQGLAQQKEKGSSGVDPSCPTGRIPEAVMLKFQAEFERTRANRFQADLEKPKLRTPDF